MRLWILILLPLGLISCNESDTRFVKKSSNQTGIDFQNNLTYTRTLTLILTEIFSMEVELHWETLIMMD